MVEVAEHLCFVERQVLGITFVGPAVERHSVEIMWLLEQP